MRSAPHRTWARLERRARPSPQTEACYGHAIGAIQVKNVSDELHERLRGRARSEGMSIGQYVLRVLEHELALPSRREWFAQLAEREPVEDLDVVGELHAAREERDEQLAERLRRR